MRRASLRLSLSALCLIIVLLSAIGADRAAHFSAMASETSSALHYKAVLIAGDWSARAFDHATETMRDRLLARQVSKADIQRLSAARTVAGHDGVGFSDLDDVLSAIEHLHPSPGEGCLMFATSHGEYGEGLVLVPSQNYLTPAALDAALTRGCGNAPTVAIISGCFSGRFTQPPMARPNRIILTAAREDRPSFGCGAEFEYTFYDRCLLRAMDTSDTWRVAYATIRKCVASRERALHFQPSEPQAFFGASVEGMPLPRQP